MPRLSRSNVVMVSLWLALSVPACAAKKPAAPQADPGKAAASQSLERLKADAARLQKDAAAVHKRLEQVDAVADDLPGLAAFRANLFATDEVLGGVAGTVDYLSTELEAAFAAGDRQREEKVTTTIASSAAEMTKFEKTVLDLAHALIPFERTVAQYRALAAAGVFFTRTLPTGFEVRAANGGIEPRLLAVLEAPQNTKTKAAARAAWLDFDRLWFVADGQELDVGLSGEQLENVAAILKAYPEAKLELAGYTTDATAGAAAKELAAGRARAVRERLVALGVADARLSLASQTKAAPRCDAKDAKPAKNPEDDCRAKQPRVTAHVAALQRTKRL